MRELTSIVLEMDQQGKRLGGFLRRGSLNTLTRAEFRDLVTTADRLMVISPISMSCILALQTFGLSRVPESPPGPRQQRRPSRVGIMMPVKKWRRCKRWQ